MQRTGRFHTHANRFRQVAIELVRFSVLVFQTALDELACLVIQHRDLLIARVKITSYNLHCSAPLFRALVASATKFTREKEPTTSSNQPAGDCGTQPKAAGQSSSHSGKPGTREPGTDG